MKPTFDPYKYSLLIAGMPDVVAEAFCGGPEYQQDIAADAAQTQALTIVRRRATVTLKPASMFGERRHISTHGRTRVAAPEGTTVGNAAHTDVRVKTNAGSIARFIWLGDAFGWARYA